MRNEANCAKRELTHDDETRAFLRLFSFGSLAFFVCLLLIRQSSFIDCVAYSMIAGASLTWCAIYVRLLTGTWCLKWLIDRSVWKFNLHLSTLVLTMFEAGIILRTAVYWWQMYPESSPAAKEAIVLATVFCVLFLIASVVAFEWMIRRAERRKSIVQGPLKGPFKAEPTSASSCRL